MSRRVITFGSANVIARWQEEPLVEDPSDEPYCPFQLPEDEYGEMMFERRLNPDGSVSPPASIRGSSARPSTVADTDGMLIFYRTTRECIV